MTTHIVCSIFDLKARIYGRPFFARSEDDAVRSFYNALGDSSTGNQFYTNPEDFRLFHIGNFDENTGYLSGFGDDTVLLYDGAMYLAVKSQYVDKSAP